MKKQNKEKLMYLGYWGVNILAIGYLIYEIINKK